MPGLLCACMFMAACDLQPKISSLPDSVGDFISDRYPALLADPATQPEIYNSAATDYGVYASPELYGSVETDDYILYSDINDYMFPAQPATQPAAKDDGTGSDETEIIIAEYRSPVVAPAANGLVADAPGDMLVVPMYGGGADVHQITVGAGETLYAIAKRYGISAQNLAEMNNIAAPYQIRTGQRLRVPGNGDIPAAPTVASPQKTAATAADAVRPDTATPAKVRVQDVTVKAGDTLYSISRAYSVPVNDLAVMNDLAAPFRLTVGQKIKVPNLEAAASRIAAKPAAAPVAAAPVKADLPKDTAKTAPVPAASKKATESRKTEQGQKNKTAPAKKISSDPKQKLPSIAARSSSKFSWPLRGKILSSFGSKPNGLVNDGINIAATRGAAVKAAENGVVAYAGNEVKGMGNLVIVQHSGGWMTVYAHLDSMAVRRGARVSVGQKIGTAGTSGKVDTPQLHFEIRKGTKAYNPSQYLKK